MKNVEYVVKINGEDYLNFLIPKIKDYKSISKIEYDYLESEKRIDIKVYSKEDITDISKFLSAMTNHAIPDYFKLRISVIKDDFWSRLINKCLLYAEIDYLGTVSKIKFNPSVELF